MADERTCYAGDLTSDVLGKVARVRVNGQVLIEDVVIHVEHTLDSRKKPITHIYFENVSGRSGYAYVVVDHNVIVTVLR